MSINRGDLRLVVDTYKFYYEKVNGMNNFIFKMTDSRAKMIENFIIQFKDLNKTKLLQETSLKRFFDYQFNYWYKRDAKYGKGVSIQIEWIIGKQALDRWIKLNKTHISYVVRKNLKKDVDFSTKETKKENWKLIEPQDYDESRKKRFLNSDIGLESCTLNTNMYNHKSKNCMVCIYSSECKELLKEIYPVIYKIRDYE